MSTKPKPRARDDYNRTLDKYFKDEIQIQKRPGPARTQQMRRVVDQCAEELAVIAATVIGGANLAGGEGTILGTVIGAIILEVLRNGLLLFGIDPYWQGVFVGAVIIFAVSIDYFRKLFRRE